MTICAPDEAEWLADTVSFLRDNLPYEAERGGWNDLASSGCQFACSALVALGEAVPAAWGALEYKHPERPKILPRFDDLCVSVLRLAEQVGQLLYLSADGSVPSPKGAGMLVYRVANTPEPPPNIASTHGAGLARASDRVKRLLNQLGVTEDGAWSEAAVELHWRTAPRAWELDFEATPRFADAVNSAFETIPGSVARTIGEFSTVTDDDIDETLELHERERAKLQEKFGRQIKQRPLPDRAQLSRSILFRRSSDIDWLFFRQWRLDDGWLSTEETKRALPIFHDRLAIALRKQIAERIEPGSPFGLSSIR